MARDTFTRDSDRDDRRSKFECLPFSRFHYRLCRPRGGAALREAAASSANETGRSILVGPLGKDGFCRRSQLLCGGSLKHRHTCLNGTGMLICRRPFEVRALGAPPQAAACSSTVRVSKLNCTSLPRALPLPCLLARLHASHERRVPTEYRYHGPGTSVLLASTIVPSNFPRTCMALAGACAIKP
jgi:hypothetical protein